MLKIVKKIILGSFLIMLMTNAAKTCANSLITKPILEVPVNSWPKDLETIREQYKQPVIVRNLANHWPSAQWTPQYFESNYSNAEIDVYVEWNEVHQKYSRDRDFYEVAKSKRVMTIKDHCQLMKNDADYLGYAVDKFFMGKHPELIDMMSFPEDTPSSKSRYFLFLGPRSTKTRLHTHEGTDVFLVQVYGKKQVSLISPKFREQCYAKINNNEERPHYVSPVDVANPDFEEYPLLKEVEVQQADLYPGDMLFFPRGWYHDVRAAAQSISVSKFMD